MIHRQHHIRRTRCGSAFELLERQFQSQRGTVWYAERIEQLGVALFGELWREEELPTETQNQTKSNHE